MEFPLPLHVDSTMIDCFRACPEKWNLEFAGGFRPPAISVDLHAGACFATALEVVYKNVWKEGRPLEAALERAHAAFLVAWGDFDIPEFKKTAKTKDRTWEAVETYFLGERIPNGFRGYQPKTDHIQPYFDTKGNPTFEYTFAIPLEPISNTNDGLGFPAHPTGTPFLYTGRLDLLGSASPYGTVGRDEKTTGRTPSQNWARSWDLRSQFIGYTWALRRGGVLCDTIVVRGVSILKEKFHFPEAIKVYSDHDRKIWLDQLRRDMWRLRRSYDEGYFDKNLGSACTSYGICPFLDVCKSPNPEPWLQQFERRYWNPLQKNPIISQEAA